MSPEPLGPSRWDLDPASWPPQDLVGAGADLEPETIVGAYRTGAFPMPDDGELLWWSPVRRGVLHPTELRVTRSLRKSCRRYETTVDRAFEDVVEACADPSRPGGWIDDAIREAYLRLHRLGWAHSVEAWDAEGRLVGGLYGLNVGGLFAGESMFHRATDASKVALVALCELMGGQAAGPGRLVDVQWQTPHLASLGVVEWPRERYLAALPDLVEAPRPDPWR